MHHRSFSLLAVGCWCLPSVAFVPSCRRVVSTSPPFVVPRRRRNGIGVDVDVVVDVAVRRCRYWEVAVAVAVVVAVAVGRGFGGGWRFNWIRKIPLAFVAVGCSWTLRWLLAVAVELVVESVEVAIRQGLEDRGCGRVAWALALAILFHQTCVCWFLFTYWLHLARPIAALPRSRRRS